MGVRKDYITTCALILGGQGTEIPEIPGKDGWLDGWLGTIQNCQSSADQTTVLARRESGGTLIYTAN